MRKMCGCSAHFRSSINCPFSAYNNIHIVRPEDELKNRIIAVSGRPRSTSLEKGVNEKEKKKSIGCC